MRASILGASVLCGLASALPQVESTATSTTSSAPLRPVLGTTPRRGLLDTGVIRECWFVLQDGTASPDGIERYVQTINGSVPGPTIYGDWGDTVRIHLTNNLTESTNGTGIHFHGGMRQNFTNPNDVVVSITQCPIEVGSSMTYEFRLSQDGSSWYHAHYGLQAWEGLFGGILINGPATANYDEDVGLIFLNDWDHQTVDELWDSAESGGPPTLDTGLLNGTNIVAQGTGSWNGTISSTTNPPLGVGI